MENLMQQQRATMLVPYSEELKEDWDNFVDNRAINSTFLHSRKFFDHNPLNAFDDSSLIFYKSNKIIAILPAVLYEKDGNRILHSHLRSTYGGFVVSSKVGIEEAVDIVEQTILFAKEKKVQQIIVRNPFRIYHTNLCDETDYAMWFCGFDIHSRELETVIHLDGDIQKIRSNYHKGAKYSLSRARRGVKVVLSDDFERFWDLLEKCLMERHKQRPVHDFSTICRLQEKVGKDKVLLFAAYHDDQLIAGNVVFNFGDRVLHGQYSASDVQFNHLSPLHAVVDFILEWGSNRGFMYFNMGTSNEQEGKKMNSGLFSYKESFGGRSVLRETLILNITEQKGFPFYCI